MARLLRMPEVAANTTEAVLQSWPIAEHTPYAAADVIATIETEKAVVDVAAEADGVILRTLVPAGAYVQVGEPIALLGDPGEQAADVDALLAELGVTAPTAERAAPGPDPRTEAAPRRAAPGQASATASGTPGSAITSPLTNAVGARRSPAAPPGRGPAAPARRVFASPLARRMAEEAGIAIEQITGTGPNGRIVRRDVEAAIRAGHAASRAAIARTAPVQAPVHTEPSAAAATARSGERPATADAEPVPPVRTGERPATADARSDGRPVPAYVDVPHSRMRAAIASRLTESKQTTPHFYLRGTAHVGRLLKLRRRLNDGPIRISVNDLVIKAAARAHALVPAMNVVWTPDAIRSFRSVDVSVAIATERGLVTPVLRSAERLSVSAIATTVQDFVERAKAGRLQQDELEGGTFTVTNLGMYGTEEFAAIINPPQSAILAVGAVHEEPVVEKGRLKVGAVMRVTLSVDHRPIDGTVAAEWMRTFLSLLESPLQILA